MATDDASSSSTGPTPVSQHSPVSGLVKALAPWRELATIAVFFGGGALWIAGYFATKKQVEALECFAEESIVLARSEASMRTNMDTMLQKDLRIEHLQSKIRDTPLTDVETVELKRLLREVEDIKETRRATAQEIKRAETALAACRKEKK